MLASTLLATVLAAASASAFLTTTSTTTTTLTVTVTKCNPTKTDCPYATAVPVSTEPTTSTILAFYPAGNSSLVANAAAATGTAASAGFYNTTKTSYDYYGGYTPTVIDTNANGPTGAANAAPSKALVGAAQGLEVNKALVLGVAALIGAAAFVV